jgi:pimeloyl-ACP methyl ester carboxylesterase
VHALVLNISKKPHEINMSNIDNIMLEVQGLRFLALAAGPEQAPEQAQLVLLLHGFPEFADAWRDVMRPIAQAGFYTVAVDQRGYSRKARPTEVRDYAVEHLVADVRGFADALGRSRFHLAGHDWGAFVAWVFAAKHPDRVQTLTALSTPHPNAFLKAVESDEDQKQRSRYISFFRMPGGAAEAYFQADHYQRLRAVYQHMVPESLVNDYIRRLSEPDALTAALNWYRALDMNLCVGDVAVPTLYVWSTQDLALGEAAAIATAEYVTGPYRFEKLEGRSHWLLEEAPDEISRLMLEHLRLS